MLDKSVFLKKLTTHEASIGVVGLGYVGLPLAVALSHCFSVIGYDISEERVKLLKAHRDPSHELSEAELAEVSIDYTSDPAKLTETPLIIVAVPTPIDENKNPDLSPLERASQAIGEHLAKGSVVVFESTVYPGVTEEVCGPELEKASGLRAGEDFFLAYSPERINPGDRERTIDKIVKIVSGQTPDVADIVAEVYGAIVTAGIHRASSIRVAEAAKVIENAQRDINIAFVNELAIIFDKMGIDTREVLEAAGTKWNFLGFRPGLVGGHCIGVDPYYLTYKAQMLGHSPQTILSGRRINDGMGRWIGRNLVKMLIDADVHVKGARVLIGGLTFKENVSDVQKLPGQGHHRRAKRLPRGRRRVRPPCAVGDRARGVRCSNGWAKRAEGLRRGSLRGRARRVPRSRRRRSRLDGQTAAGAAHRSEVAFRPPGNETGGLSLLAALNA